MPWTYVDPTDASDLGRVLQHFKALFGRLSRSVICYERVVSLPYGVNVRPDGSLDRVQVIVATNAVAFQIDNPTKPVESVKLVLEIFNNTAGALGAITLGTEYQTAGAIVAPAAGKRRLYGFYRTGTLDAAAPKWRETWRSAADI